jgi:hypothetical protein
VRSTQRSLGVVSIGGLDHLTSSALSNTVAADSWRLRANNDTARLIPMGEERQSWPMCHPSEDHLWARTG